MYEDFMKMAQESLKPMLKMAENNTALAVKLMQAQADTTAEMLKGNLAHFQALAETKDLNAAVEMQQKYVEALNESSLLSPRTMRPQSKQRSPKLARFSKVLLQKFRRKPRKLPRASRRKSAKQVRKPLNVSPR